MSDELVPREPGESRERGELAEIEGEVVEESFTDAEQAREFYTTTALMAGDAALRQATVAQRLVEADRRLGWKVLGYQSNTECFQDIFAGVFQLTADVAKRLPLVAEMRRAEMNTVQIAEALNVHRATVSRDLARAREIGLLDEEPSRLVGKDGKPQPVRRVPAQGESPMLENDEAREGEEEEQDEQPRDAATAVASKTEEAVNESDTIARRSDWRTDLLRPWRNNVDDLGRITRSLTKARGGDNYSKRLQDLADYTGGDLVRYVQVLLGVLEDFAVVKPVINEWLNAAQSDGAERCTSTTPPANADTTEDTDDPTLEG